jgi:hypothetical protein
MILQASLTLHAEFFCHFHDFYIIMFLLHAYLIFVLPYDGKSSSNVL